MKKKYERHHLTVRSTQALGLDTQSSMPCCTFAPGTSTRLQLLFWLALTTRWDLLQETQRNHQLKLELELAPQHSSCALAEQEQTSLFAHKYPALSETEARREKPIQSLAPVLTQMGGRK